MRANTVTKLSLHEFATILGMNPLHFGGIDLEAVAGAYCARPLPQYEWQHGDRSAREAVAKAIADAEANIERYLGFRVLPSWEVNELHDAYQSFRPELGGVYASRSYHLNWKKLVEAGKRISTAIETASIAWGASGFWQRGTVTATVAAGQDPEEIHIYYPGKSGDPAWEIRPIEVSIAGTTATITFPRECAVAESLWDALEFAAADGEDDGDFLTEVDVYRVYNAPDDNTVLEWEPWGLCACDGQGTCAGCTISTQTGCFYIRDELTAQVNAKPGTWADSEFTAAEFENGRRPDQARFFYRAGHRDLSLAMPTRTIQRDLARAIAYYAAALLDREPCDCTVDAWLKWRAKTRGEVRFAAQVGQLSDNPLGDTVGAAYAWGRVLELTLGEGAVISR